MVPDYKTRIEFRNGQITIRCKTHGIPDSNYRDVKLVLDTGATISGISENLAIELGYDLLQHSVPQDFDTAGGTQPLRNAISIVLSYLDYVYALTDSS